MTATPSQAPALPPLSIPTVTLELDPPRMITFDYARLEAIEVGMNMSVLQVVRQLVPQPQEPAGEAGDGTDAPPDAGTRGQDVTPEREAELGARLKIGFAARFVAACLGVGLEELPRLVPMPKLIGVFFQLSSGLADALGQLQAGVEDPDAGPREPGTGASGTSEPGPASS